MALEITGKLIKVLSEVTGEGKNGTWRKQEFVIETLDAYPKKICMELWGDKLRMIDGCQEGDMLKVSFEVESRPYQDRWFTGVKAWRVERDNSGATSNNNTQAQNTNTNTRQNAPIPQDPYPDDMLGNGGGADELPF